MTDLWAFLLQTLNASAAALLLLTVKALLADRLSPRWQFGVWSVLGLTLLLPANLLGRHGLPDLPLAVETLKTLVESRLSSAYTGPYTLTRITVPVPLWSGAAPVSVTDWLFLVYAAGVLFFLLRSLLSYLGLRALLRRSAPASPEMAARVEAVAAAYGLNPCRAVEAEGLDSAFVCGLLRPVLVLPAGKETDDKVLLHELLHLKYGDVAWGWLVCLLRCPHWCNPLLRYVFDRVGNDCESLCDQRVLERPGWWSSTSTSSCSPIWPSWPGAFPRRRRSPPIFPAPSPTIPPSPPRPWTGGCSGCAPPAPCSPPCSSSPCPRLC